MSTGESRWSRFWSKLPTAYRGAVILVIPVISIIPAIASWSWSRQAKNEAYWWISHTEEVIRESRKLTRVLVDSETGIRGYVITQQTEFLEPYREAEKEIPASLSKLTELIADNPEQQQQLEQIKQQIQTRLNLLTQILNTISAQPELKRSPQLTKLYAGGRAEMNAIRQSIDNFKDEEWRLLDIRQQRLAQISEINNFLLGVTLLSALLGYGVAIKLYYQSESKLEQRAKELTDLNKNLAATNQLVQSRNHELDQFAHIVSHDLKAPLRAISNLSEWIEEDLEGKLDEDTSKNMSLLRNRVQRMNDFIDGLLEYSRAGKINREKTTVDVNKLLEEVIDLIAPPPNFALKTAQNMPILETEALLLQQVFSNLISNSIKHHHSEKGTIEISVQELDKYYQFAVADDGVGIAPEHQEKIFVIFQTLSGRDTKESTGIGLSIVKKIIENQGGKIWLESELDRGSTFFFTWSKS